MSEGNVYTVRWTRDDDRWRVTLAERKAITAEGATLQDALDELIDPICDAWGDGEPQFRFSPALPHDPRVERFDRYRDLSPNCWCNADTSGDSFFAGGRCPECGSARGPRTDEPARIESVDHSGHLRFLLGNENRGLLMVGIAASEAFVEEGPRAFLDAFEPRRCVMPKGSRRRLFELIPRRPSPNARWSGLDYEAPERCPACGVARRNFAARAPSPPWIDDGGYDFVRRSDLPAPAPAVIVANEDSRLRVSVRPDWYEPARSERWFKDIADDGVTCVIPDDEASPRPSDDAPYNPWGGAPR